MPNVLAWVLSAITILVLLITAPIVVLIPLGIILGGASAAAAFLLIGLTIGFEEASKYDPAVYITPSALSSIIVIISMVRHVVQFFRAGYLPSIIPVVTQSLIYLFTLHLSFQTSLGAAVAVGVLLLGEGASPMTTDALVVSLFSFVVFIVATTFTSYFMRSLIPWRNEHPRFSDAVAYTISTLLGLIAATYAFAGKDVTFRNANDIGALLYQASVAIATIGATAVGAYVALIDRRSRRNSNGDGPAV
jgi:hypothetical protein